MAVKGLVACALEYDSKLRAVLYRYTKNVSDTEELLQETYARLHRIDSEQRAQIRSVLAFATRLAVNIALDWCRRRSIVPIELVADMEVLNQFDPDALSVEEQVDQAQQSELLIAAMKSLPPRCREILLLRKAEGMSHQAIASQLDVSLHIVDNDLKKALRLLRACMRSQTDKEAS